MRTRSGSRSKGLELALVVYNLVENQHAEFSRIYQHPAIRSRSKFQRQADLAILMLTTTYEQVFCAFPDFDGMPIAFSSQSYWAESCQLIEYKVKASYLFIFTKCVEWSPAALYQENQVRTMCFVGKNPLNGVIEILTGKTIKNRRLIVQQLSRINKC